MHGSPRSEMVDLKETVKLYTKVRADMDNVLDAQPFYWCTSCNSFSTIGVPNPCRDNPGCRCIRILKGGYNSLSTCNMKYLLEFMAANQQL